jgi:hypothetical protein
MRPSWAIAAVALVLAACGASKGERFNMTTPGAHTGSGVRAATAPPNPAPEPSATPAPKAKGKPVTRAEKRVIKGWADSLRRGRVNAASRYFSVPSRISNNTPDWVYLDSPSDVKEFNRTLPCGAKLLRTRRGVDGFAVGIFRLTERKGVSGEGCGSGVGDTAAVAFQIRKRHIQQWVRVELEQVEPGAAASPTATPSTTPSKS